MPWTQLSHALAKYKKDRQLHAAYICSVAQQVLEDEARAASFKHGRLTLVVSSSARAANIHIQSANIIKAINQKLGTETVRQLRFRVG